MTRSWPQHGKQAHAAAPSVPGRHQPLIVPVRCIVQMGADVGAVSLEVSPVDRVFVRMGGQRQPPCWSDLLNSLSLCPTPFPPLLKNLKKKILHMHVYIYMYFFIIFVFLF